MQIKSIKIIVNPKKEWAIKLAKEVGLFLIQNKFKISKQKADLTICIGGDGTILYANHKDRIDGAILGIGSRTSVVCILRNDNWKEKILDLIKSANVEKRLSLLCEFEGKKISAINDVVIHSCDYRVIKINLKINGETFEFQGDGVIISTPTGSTAYAYSAGGKTLSTVSREIEIVPICPYKRTFETEITDQNSEIEIICDRGSALIIDGIFIGKVKPNQTIRVKKGEDVSFIV